MGGLGYFKNVFRYSYKLLLKKKFSNVIQVPQ